MQKIIKYFLLIFILLNFKVLAKENFFQEAKDLLSQAQKLLRDSILEISEEIKPPTERSENIIRQSRSILSCFS